MLQQVSLRSVEPFQTFVEHRDGRIALIAQQAPYFAAFVAMVHVQVLQEYVIIPGVLRLFARRPVLFADCARFCLLTKYYMDRVHGNAILLFDGSAALTVSATFAPMVIFAIPDPRTVGAPQNSAFQLLFRSVAAWADGVAFHSKRVALVHAMGLA